MTAPERLHMKPNDRYVNGWGRPQETDPFDDDGTEYIRADLCLAPTQAADAALERAAQVAESVLHTRCDSCGHPRSDHPYRHPFVSKTLTDIPAAIRALKSAPASTPLAAALELPEVKTLAEAVERYRQTAEVVGGCGDGGCVIHRPGGQHTNGGCRCTYRMDDTRQREVTKLLLVAQGIVKALAALKGGA
jgi:hypothetical protein